MTIETVQPSTAKPLERYSSHGPAEVEDRLAASWEAFVDWRQRSIADRTSLLERVAEVLESDSRRWAQRMADEMGKPLGQGVSEVEKCAWACRYYAEHAASFLASRPVVMEGGSYRPTQASIAFRPLGPILAVMPWNFPFWQVLRFAAPAIAAGNTALLKHASNVTGCALDLEEIFRRAEAPEGLFTALLIDREAVGEVIEDSRVRGVTLTGSERAGRAVASRAGGALKKTVLELGGSDPYLVLEDADLELAVGACVNSRLINAGQSCIAAKRFIVPRKLLPSFEEAALELMRSKVVGDPLVEGTDVGPMAREDLRETLHRQVQDSVDAGARLLLGGELPSGDGFFYPVTLLSEVTPSMPAGCEELFGPVAAIVVAENEDHAVELANGTSFGLGAAVFTTDRQRGQALAENRLEAGCCFVNDFVRSDPRLPFGGVKDSGYGRELSSFGIHEFVNVKTVVLA